MLDLPVLVLDLPVLVLDLHVLVLDLHVLVLDLPALVVDLAYLVLDDGMPIEPRQPASPARQRGQTLRFAYCAGGLGPKRNRHGHNP